MRKYRNICIDATCNLKCQYCGGSTVKIDQQETIQKLGQILDRFQPEESCFKVECFGEITLYPEIIQYLEEKAIEGYRFELLSNGTNLKAVALDTNLHWIFSLDGHTEEMNQHRNLKQGQIDPLLQRVLEMNAEIQTVYWGQSVEEMNQFIGYLQGQGYDGFLHIFPQREFGKKLDLYLDYESLEKVDFIPNAEYFRRWKHLVDGGEREFVCDFFTNGYVYRISPEEILMNKCDCSSGSFRYEHSFEEEMSYKVFPCGNCITHYEYNNQRQILKG